MSNIVAHHCGTPTTFGTFDAETTRFTAEPGTTAEPAVGLSLSTLPVGTVLDDALVTVPNTKPALVIAVVAAACDRKQKEYYAMGKEIPAMLAKTCVAMGKRQEALQLLKVSYSRHDKGALWFLTEPDLRTLEDEPEYKELVKKIHFPTSLTLSGFYETAVEIKGVLRFFYY